MNDKKDHSHIQGWGADLDWSDRPAYPKERIPPQLPGLRWDQPQQQEQIVEILHSIERPGITPIFGTAVPPSGLSGPTQEYAFRFSENDLRHWLLLLFADRVNVGEGLLSDLSRGHIPNIYAETGWKSELKYNQQGAIRKVAIASVVLGIGICLAKRKKQ